MPDNHPHTHAANEGIEFVFSSGLQKIEQQMALIDSIDLKMGVLIGFLGAFVVGVLAALFASDPAKIGHMLSRAGKLVFGLASILGMCSLFFAFLGFKMRQYYSGFKFSKLVEWTNEEVGKTQEAFMKALLDSVLVNDEQIKRKQKYARLAIWFVFLTLVALLAAAGIVGVKLLATEAAK